MADQQKHPGHERSEEKSYADSHQIGLLQKSPITENSDCLEHIFMHLDVKTLLNSVARCSKLFQTSAASAFKRTFGTNSILLCCFDNCRHKDCHYKRVDRISFADLKMILPFLRVFGAQISKLEVHYYSCLHYSFLDQRKRSVIDLKLWRMNEYINMYCTNTLSNLKLYYKPKLSNDLAKPFEQIEQLCMRWTYLNEQLLDFVECFPNLQRLDMLADSMDQRFTKVSLPQLKHLVISFTNSHHDKQANMVEMQNVGEFLQANPQLQSVTVNKCHVKNEHAIDLFNMVSGNAQLTKVEFNVHSGGFRVGITVEEADVNQLVNEHQQLVELAIYEEHLFTADAAFTVIRQLNSLQKFRFNIKNNFEHNKFINQLGSDWIYTSKSLNYHFNARDSYKMNLHRK